MKRQMTQSEVLNEKIPRKESVLAIFYFALHLAYLVAAIENEFLHEFLHWVTLVIIPLVLIFIYRRAIITNSTFTSTLASIGLSKSRMRSGIGLAAIVGIGCSLLQFAISESVTEMIEVFSSGKFVILMPLAFGMMLITAGFTEEFFFRGILQTRIQALLKSNVLAIVITAICFGLYHLPYAFLSPSWPSKGDFPAALASALSQGGVAGLILGWLYVRSGRNLIACVVAHSLINTLPAMTMIRFEG